MDCSTFMQKALKTNRFETGLKILKKPKKTCLPVKNILSSKFPVVD